MCEQKSPEKTASNGNKCNSYRGYANYNIYNSINYSNCSNNSNSTGVDHFIQKTNKAHIWNSIEPTPGTDVTTTVNITVTTIAPRENYTYYLYDAIQSYQGTPSKVGYFVKFTFAGLLFFNPRSCLSWTR